MKLKLFSVLALSGLIAAGVACGNSSDDETGDGGSGGSGGETGTTKTSTTATKSSASTGMTNTTTGTQSTASGTQSCDDIGVCAGDGMNGDSGRLSSRGSSFAATTFSSWVFLEQPITATAGTAAAGASRLRRGSLLLAAQAGLEGHDAGYRLATKKMRRKG